MDLKNVNAKHKDVRLNTVLQNFMFTMLKVRDTLWNCLKFPFQKSTLYQKVQTNENDENW